MATLEQTRVLSTPSVFVNGRLVAIIPNSLKEKEPGEVAVRAVSAGGNAVAHVAGTNAESLKGMVSFAVPLTSEMVALVEEWRTNSNAGIWSTIETINGTRQKAYESMWMTDAPEYSYEAEGSIEMTWEGSLPAIS